MQPFNSFRSQNFQISGIVSYGYGCGKDGLPGIYTNVASYLGWIAVKMIQTHTAPGSNDQNQENPSVSNSTTSTVPALEQGTIPNPRPTQDLFHRERNSNSNPLVPSGSTMGMVVTSTEETALSNERPLIRKAISNPEILEDRSNGQVGISSGKINLSQQPFTDLFHRVPVANG